MRNLAVTAGLVCTLLACGGPAGGPSDCEAMGAGAARDECWSTHAPTLFRATSDPDAAVALISQQVEDQQIRDFIWLTITREVDPSSYRYCRLIEEQALAERCRVLVSRPHLHRELVGGQAGGAGGGPPPGGGPPGGGPPGGGPPPGHRPPPGQNAPQP